MIEEGPVSNRALLFVPVFFASGVSCPRPYAQRMATARCVEKWQVGLTTSLDVRRFSLETR